MILVLWNGFPGPIVDAFKEMGMLENCMIREDKIIKHITFCGLFLEAERNKNRKLLNE
jgi:hypothetical protein